MKVADVAQPLHPHLPDDMNRTVLTEGCEAVLAIRERRPVLSDLLRVLQEFPGQVCVAVAGKHVPATTSTDSVLSLISATFSGVVPRENTFFRMHEK